MAQTSQTVPEGWKEARYAGVSRVLRMGMSGIMILATVVLFFLVDATLRSSIYVIALVLGLIAVGIYDILSVMRARLLWNQEGIRREGLFRVGKLHLWKDLTYVEKSMNSRATVLTFKGVWKIKIFWAYRAHRELAALAKQELKNNRSRRSWRKSKQASPDEAAQEQQIEDISAPDTGDTATEANEQEKPETGQKPRIEPTLTKPQNQDA